MEALITWPTYGNWLPGHGRGGFEIDPTSISESLPQPTNCGVEVGQPPSPWPMVRLDAAQQETVLRDLQRVAELREFVLNCALIAPTFVCILIIIDEQRDLNRLVQLIKGATARALTVAAGDELPTDAHGETLPHYKWWSRQHAVLKIGERAARQRVADLLRRRANRCEHGSLWSAQEND